MACYTYQIVINSNDLANAVGNTNPAFNGVVFFSFTDCYGNPQLDQFSSTGTYYPISCVDDTQPNFLYYWNNNLQSFATFSTALPDLPCSVTTPTPTPTNTTTPTLSCVTSVQFEVDSAGDVGYVDCCGATIYLTFGIGPQVINDCIQYGSLVPAGASISFVTYGVTSCNCTTSTPTPTPTQTPTIAIDCSFCSGTGWQPYDYASCYRINTTSATAPVTPINLAPHDVNVYSSFGTRFYQAGFPSSGIGTVQVQLGTPIVGGLYTNPTWSNPNLLTTVGPLNRCALWTNPFSPTPTNTWIGFSDCLSGIPTTKTYYVGIGADNEFKLILDGVEVLNTVGNIWVDEQFKWWHVYPIEIGAGDHTLELYGLNLGSDAGFGCEIYDNTLEDLTGFTSYSQINVIYTSSGETQATIVQNLSGNYLSSGYTCPSGYVYSTCSGSCVEYEFCVAAPQTNNTFIGRIAYNNGIKVGSALNTGNISLAVNNSVNFNTLNWCASCGVCNEYTIIADSYFMGKTTLANVRPLCYCTNSTDLNVLLSSINKIAATKFEGPFANLESAMTWIENNGLFITNQNYPPIVTDGNVLHLDSGLPASYPLVGTSWYDLTENSNNSVLINGVTYNSSSKGYLDFNGSNQYVSVTGTTNIPIGNSNYTIGVWFNADTLGNKGLVGWGNYGTNNEVNAFRLTSNGLVNYWWLNDLTVTTTITPGNWYYAVATFDGTTRSIYVNGSLVGSDTPTGHNVTTSGNLTVGVTNSTEYFDGFISDVQIFDRAITSNEILQNYNSFLKRYDGTNTEICLTPIYCTPTPTPTPPCYDCYEYTIEAVEGTVYFEYTECGGGTATNSTNGTFSIGCDGIREGSIIITSGSANIIQGNYCNGTCPTPTLTLTASPTQTPTPTPFSEFFSATTCNTTMYSNAWAGSGGRGIFTVTVDVGTGTGTTNLIFDAYSIPDKWVVIWDGNTVIDTGFRGDSIYNSQLNALGYPNVSGPASGNTSFNKTSSLPSVVTVVITAPLEGTAWESTLQCPANPPTPTPTSTFGVTPTPTSTIPCNTIYTHGALRATCGDFCNTNYPIQTIECATQTYLNLTIGDFIYGYSGQAGYLAYSNVSTDTNTGPFRIADIDVTGQILGIYVCSGGNCVPL